MRRKCWVTHINQPDSINQSPGRIFRQVVLFSLILEENITPFNMMNTFLCVYLSLSEGFGFFFHWLKSSWNWSRRQNVCYIPIMRLHVQLADSSSHWRLDKQDPSGTNCSMWPETDARQCVSELCTVLTAVVKLVPVHLRVSVLSLLQLASVSSYCWSGNSVNQWEFKQGSQRTSEGIPAKFCSMK